MKSTILAAVIALGLGAAFIVYSTVSFAQRCDANYADERSETTPP